MSTWIQCPHRFKLSKIDRVPEPPSIEAVRGSFVHEVLENLLQYAPDLRTEAAAMSLMKSLWVARWQDEVARDFDLNEEQLREFQWAVRWAVEAYFNIEDPAAAQPKGNEHKLTGTVGGAHVLGILDRWDLTENGGARIIDYKTGKPSRPPYDVDKKMQLMVYADLFQQNFPGTKVEQGSLYYLKGEGVIVDYEVNDETIEEARATVGRVWGEIQDACTTGEFETRPGRLCDWCAFRATCPAWN